MGIIEKYIITVNFTKTNIFQAKKKKKAQFLKIKALTHVAI